MPGRELHVVTGAYGYSGKYIAARLLKAGHQVRTLTNSIQRANPFGNEVEARPFNFNNPAKLVEALRGAKAFYNTYWVRFNHGNFSHATAVENTLKLFAACREAGVNRVVHVSITNPSEDSSLEYFRGKARLERALRESGLSYVILRPAILFGAEDILLNNIAWSLRHFPVFGVFGNGDYKLQPIYVDDLAQLAFEQGRLNDDRVIDAIGPETFTYRELVLVIGEIIDRTRPIVSVPPLLGYLVGRLTGTILGDVLITRDEIKGLMENRLWTQSPPVGLTRLSEWAQAHAKSLGAHYASELARRRNREKAYQDL